MKIMKILIQAEGLAKLYGDNDRLVRVLEDLDLKVYEGERIAVVGESGVGKSTLLHILGTLDRPSKGKVTFAGEDVFALSERDLAAFRNREVGFVFQFHHLLADFTAWENVMMPALISGKSWAQAQAQAEEILCWVGLKERLTHKPGELSGGEQQRVAVARALILRPRVVFADEPTGNLDPATGEGVVRLLFELNKEQGTTMVVVTHSEKLAAAMDRTLRLSKGKLAPLQAQGILLGGKAGL
jgi:lipoprotein-releasing system ATP-binding protein